MLRKFLDYQLEISQEGKPLHKFRPLIKAIDTFLFEAAEETKASPHIRDGIDLKRVMMLVIYALLPCILMAIWNTGVQKLVYSSGSLDMLNAFRSSYFAFCSAHFWSILANGFGAFIPIMLISYLAGGFWEALFAITRRHEISEGFLVTGMLYALILPPTIPYWMVAVGVSVGVILSKELFGGTGYNILNPALVCRTFLYFTFPTKMSGSLWVGTNPTVVQQSISKMNAALGFDGISQATALGVFNLPPEVKQAHIDTLIAGATPNLSPEVMSQALQFAQLKVGSGIWSNLNLFFGNMLGSMGETSTLACLLGALILIITGIGSWRTMLAYALGVAGCALLFQAMSGPTDPANYAFPFYKHFLIGGLAFGLVFMATDPVSSPDMNASKWAYGLIIGIITVVIRIVNPAFPEGVMLAILFGNIIAPLLDHLSLKMYRRRRFAQ
ncbi:MAG: NADH:ubiquinone reductase (Na(+)-transporting) subunit B [Chlamydiales bacterium]|nr:NADH:ubiquinone reductase (Na(+)-transporting) subunit B [Chlamydiales bacterium]